MLKGTDQLPYQRIYRISLLKYLKPTNEQFDNILKHYKENSVFNELFLELLDFLVPIPRRDLLTYNQISFFLNGYAANSDALMIGDIFWETGQHICRWCKEHNKMLFFLQHGQWIWYENKKNPKYLPDATFIFGEKLNNMIKSWPYSQRSKVVVTGNPRYDNLVQKESKDYVYFSPPVIEEIVHDNPSGKINVHNLNLLQFLSRHHLDNVCKLLIQPHYREARIDIIEHLFPRAFIVDPLNCIFELIAESKNVLCHRDSTVVLDALAFGKSPMIIDFVPLVNRVLKKGYFGQFAMEYDNISDFINDINTPHFIDINDTGLREYIYLGNASQRILHSILGIIRGKHD